VSQARPTTTPTLDRLEHRVSRVATAVISLRQRAGDHRRALGAPPPRMREAIADLEAQIASMKTRLHELSLDDGSTTALEGRPDENGHRHR
jgi:hypothetical protein